MQVAWTKCGKYAQIGLAIFNLTFNDDRNKSYN